MMKYSNLKSFPITLLAAAITAGPAMAAEIEEVSVTAEKKAASIQDVPMSVAAIAGDAIGVGKISSMNDIADQTPGMSVGQFSMGETRVYIRGIGNSSDSAASDSAVGIFIDEVYIGRAGGTGFDLFDLERVEVLKGPQGTLYGKNTSGGAINFITTRPSQEQSIKTSLTAGSDGLFNAQALINGGITDSVAGKLSISSKQRDGFEKNVIRDADIVTESSLSNSPIIGNSVGAAGAGKDLGDLESINLRGQLLFDLSEDTSWLLSADYSKDESNGNCRHLTNISSGIMGTNALWQGAIDQLSEEYAGDPRTCATQYDLREEREIRGLTSRVEHDLAWADFLSITAWRASDVYQLDDLTGIPLTNINVPYSAPENVIDGVEESASQISQEFRLSGTSGSLDWIAGLYYLQEEVSRDEEYYTRYNAAMSGGLGLAATGNVLFVQDNTTTSTAAYAQANWHLNDDWSLIYGVRWSRDKKEIMQDARDLLGTGFPTGVPLILPEFAEPVYGSDSWEDVTNRATANYRFGEDAMVYLTYSEGFKSGAFPSQANLAANAVQTVDPEMVKNIELGLKSAWFDNRLQFNLAYYDISYDDLQVFELTPTLLLVLNNAQATSQGLEATMAVAATDNLTIRANYNSGKARFDHFINSGGADYAGNQLPQAADRSGSLDVDYTLPLSGGSYVDFGLNYAWKGDFYLTASNNPDTLQEAVGKVNASATWNSADESLSVMAWGRNLTDELQLETQIVDPTAITSEKYADPRTYGLTLTKTF